MAGRDLVAYVDRRGVVHVDHSGAPVGGTPAERLSAMLRDLVRVLAELGVISPAEQCAICGRDLATGLPGTPAPLLPGDMPGELDVCAACRPSLGPLPPVRTRASWVAEPPAAPE